MILNHRFPQCLFRNVLQLAIDRQPNIFSRRCQLSPISAANKNSDFASRSTRSDSRRARLTPLFSFSSTPATPLPFAVQTFPMTCAATSIVFGYERTLPSRMSSQSRFIARKVAACASAHVLVDHEDIHCDAWKPRPLRVKPARRLRIKRQHARPSSSAAVALSGIRLGFTTTEVREEN